MFSITSTLFNVIQMGFSWTEAIDNWVNFLQDSGEIVLVVNKSEDDTLASVQRYVDQIKVNSLVKFKIIESNISYSNPLFDGIIKNIAYKNASQPFVISLDVDEVINRSNKKYWEKCAFDLSQRQEDAFFIPSVDIFFDDEHYFNINFKFYLVKNKSYISRGVVNYAKKEGGTIDIKFSDSTEFLAEDGNLIKVAHILNPNLPNFMKIRMLDSNPFVYHLGWKDLQQRKKINSYWKPVWQARAGHEVNDIPLTDEDFKKIPYFKHNLPHWNQR